MMPSLVFQRLFGLWLLVMFLMTLSGWQPPESMLSEAGSAWAQVNLRLDMMVALALIYGIGAAAFLLNRFAAFGALVQTPLAVNMAMYHAFVNQVLIPGGLIAALYFACVATMLWLNRSAYLPLFEIKAARHGPSKRS